MKVCAITTWRGEDHPEERSTVGLFQDSADAFEALEHNWGDLNEGGWFPWAIVEEMEFGLYPDLIFVAAYLFDQEGGEWRKCPGMPDAISKRLEKCVSFAQIG